MSHITIKHLGGGDSWRHPVTGAEHSVGDRLPLDEHTQALAEDGMAQRDDEPTEAPPSASAAGEGQTGAPDDSDASEVTEDGTDDASDDDTDGDDADDAEADPAKPKKAKKSAKKGKR